MISSEKISIKGFYYNDLFRDYIFNFKNIREFYEYDYRNIEHYEKRILDVKAGYDEKNRLRLYDILKSYNRNIGCGKKTIENIEKLGKKDSLVVIGGQQPGFLTGPMFIIFKILTVLKISSYFEKRFNMPVVPCFWNASDDNNFSQVDNLNIIDDGITNIKLELSDFDVKTRYSDIFIDASKIEETIEKVEGVLHPTDFTVDIMDSYKDILAGTVKNCSNAEGKINISSFFSSVVTGLFSSYGIIIIDPDSAELKRLSLDLLGFDMDNYNKITDLITLSGKRLSSQGYHSQLGMVPGTLNFFLKSGNARIKIHSEGNDLFRFSNKKYSKRELRELITGNHDDISLNVVLRPLFQDKCLPVLCSVCGPGEVSYFAQLKPVYGLTAVKMPIIYPRFSATVIEKRIEKLIKGLKIQYSELESDKRDMIKRVIDENLEIDLNKLIADFGNNLQKGIEELERSISDYKMNISSSFDRIKRNTKKEIKVLNKKLYSEYKKQNEFMIKSIDKIYSSVFPSGNLQERKINIISYLNKYSFNFIDELYMVIKPMDFLHKFLKIN